MKLKRFIFLHINCITLILVSIVISASNKAENVCNRIISSAQDPTDAQTAGGSAPAIVSTISWQRPAIAISKGGFSGTNGSPASHEGVDYIHSDASVAEVVIRATADGKVVYVREGCEQSSMFAHNNIAREAGAGWGNHIVISHKSAVYTRYGHLLKNSILVNTGDSVKLGQIIAVMGNSGRSETRHLHFELGTKSTNFDPCAMSQNFDRVYNPELLNYQAPTGIISIEGTAHNTLKVFPNPTHKSFTIISTELIRDNIDIKLVDVSGKMYACIFKNTNGEFAKTYTITDDISKGLHLLIIKQKENIQVLKINIV